MRIYDLKKLISCTKRDESVQIDILKNQIYNLKNKLSDTRVKNSSSIDKLKNQVSSLKCQISEIRKDNQLKIEKLNKKIKDYRKVSIKIDNRKISPIKHNSQASMDDFFYEIKDESPYIMLAESIKKILYQNSILLDKKNILDIGVGPGIALSHLVKESSPTKITGNDFSISAVKQAAVRIPEGKFYIHDIYSPQIEKAEIVFNTEVLEHLEKPQDALRNILEAVDPGGIAIITVPDGRVDNSRYHINFWSPESWRIFVSKYADEFECTFDEFQTRDDLRSRNNIAILRRR